MNTHHPVKIIFSFLLIFLSYTGWSSMWKDPDWKEMIIKSDVIALVQVIEGGKFWAQVSASRVFKGSLQVNPFWVTGYNNNMWPSDAIEKESFKKGESYYLFLKKPVLNYYQTMAKYMKEYEFLVECIKKNSLLVVHTPTAGDIPVKETGIYYDLLKTGYSHYADPRDREEFEELLNESITHHREKKINHLYVNKIIDRIKDQLKNPGNNDYSHHLMILYLCGAAIYNNIFAECAETGDVQTNFALARLLGNIDGPEAENLLIRFLDNEDSIVQGEAVRQLTRRMDREKLGPLLLRHLESSGTGGIYPDNIMDPVRNTLDGGKIEIIKTLGKIRYREAAKHLLPLLDTDNAYLFETVIDVLVQLGSKEYIPYLIKHIEEDRLVKRITSIITDKKIKQTLPALHEYLKSYKQHSWHDVRCVISTLEQIGNKESCTLLTDLLKECIKRDEYSFEDCVIIEQTIEALTGLKSTDSRDVIYNLFYSMYGLSRIFLEKPELYKMKKIWKKK